MRALPLLLLFLVQEDPADWSTWKGFNPGTTVLLRKTEEQKDGKIEKLYRRTLGEGGKVKVEKQGDSGAWEELLVETHPQPSKSLAEAKFSAGGTEPRKYSIDGKDLDVKVTTWTNADGSTLKLTVAEGLSLPRRALPTPMGPLRLPEGTLAFVYEAKGPKSSIRLTARATATAQTVRAAGQEFPCLVQSEEAEHGMEGGKITVTGLSWLSSRVPAQVLKRQTLTRTPEAEMKATEELIEAVLR